MQTAAGRKRTMRSAADATYPLLGALVEKAQQRSGSKMNAYADVARAIGETGSWVRKFLGRQRVRLDADTFLKINDLYDRECDRWEAEAELQKARFLALRSGANAMAQDEVSRLDVGTGRPSRSSRRTAPLVAALVDEVEQ